MGMHGTVWCERKGGPTTEPRGMPAFRSQVEMESLLRRPRRSHLREGGVPGVCEISQSASACGEPGCQSRSEKSSSTDRAGVASALLLRHTNTRAGPTGPWPAPGHSLHHGATHPPPQQLLKCFLFALWIRLADLDLANKALQALALADLSQLHLSPLSSCMAVL